MPGRPVPRRRGRQQAAKPRARRPDLRGLIPTFLRPESRVWNHWNRAAIEILQGVRAALDECIDAVERSGRRREGARLRRIEVR